MIAKLYVARHIFLRPFKLLFADRLHIWNIRAMYCIKSYGWMNIVQLFQRIISRIAIESGKLYFAASRVCNDQMKKNLFRSPYEIWYMITLTPNLRKVNQINAVAADYSISWLIIDPIFVIYCCLNVRLSNLALIVLWND